MTTTAPQPETAVPSPIFPELQLIEAPRVHELSKRRSLAMDKNYTEFALALEQVNAAIVNAISLGADKGLFETDAISMTEYKRQLQQSYSGKTVDQCLFEGLNKKGYVFTKIKAENDDDELMYIRLFWGKPILKKD
jgi:hypothetical protein